MFTSLSKAALSAYTSKCCSYQLLNTPHSFIRPINYITQHHIPRFTYQPQQPQISFIFSTVTLCGQTQYETNTKHHSTLRTSSLHFQFSVLLRLFLLLLFFFFGARAQLGTLPLQSPICRHLYPLLTSSSSCISTPSLRPWPPHLIIFLQAFHLIFLPCIPFTAFLGTVSPFNFSTQPTHHILPI